MNTSPGLINFLAADPYAMTTAEFENYKHLYSSLNHAELPTCTFFFLSPEPVVSDLFLAIAQLFAASQLPTDDLGAIWTIANMRQTGVFDLTEFCVASHLIALRVNGTAPIPPSLPPSLLNSVRVRFPPNLARFLILCFRLVCLLLLVELQLLLRFLLLFKSLQLLKELQI